MHSTSKILLFDNNNKNKKNNNNKLRYYFEDHTNFGTRSITFCFLLMNKFF